jgi:hypothetical protein
VRDPVHHDYDDTDGDSRHTHSDHHQHYRNAPKYGRLLASESNLFRERKARFARGPGRVLFCNADVRPGFQLPLQLPD